jgi:hypothetical protein
MKKLVVGLFVFVLSISLINAAEATQISFTDTTIFEAWDTNPPEDYVAHGWEQSTNLMACLICHMDP